MDKILSLFFLYISKSSLFYFGEVKLKFIKWIRISWGPVPDRMDVEVFYVI
jgi:hypothetical protein